MARRSTHKRHLYDDNAAEALGSLGELIGVRMRRVDIILNRCMFSVADELSLKPPALLCLALIVNNPGLAQNDLTRQTTSDKSTIVGVVDQLEKLGWAKRKVFPDDRRRHALFPTKKGEDTLNLIAGRLKERENKLLSKITPKELDLIVDLLDRMHDSCMEELDILDVKIMS